MSALHFYCLFMTFFSLIRLCFGLCWRLHVCFFVSRFLDSRLHLYKVVYSSITQSITNDLRHSLLKYFGKYRAVS